MNIKSENITWHPSKMTKIDRQRLNGHKSVVIWFTGLSGAGKSTLAGAVEQVLYQSGIGSYVLDGDNIRRGLNSDLGFSPAERTENLRRIGEVSKLFVEAGLFVLTACISPYQADRGMVRALFEQGEFIEVYVRCPLEECERRDPKGLYRKARSGEILQFTGISAPYEAPERPDVIIDSDKLTLEQSVALIMGYLKQYGYLEHGLEW